MYQATVLLGRVVTARIEQAPSGAWRLVLELEVNTLRWRVTHYGDHVRDDLPLRGEMLFATGRLAQPLGLDDGCDYAMIASRVEIMHTKEVTGETRPSSDTAAVPGVR